MGKCSIRGATGTSSWGVMVGEELPRCTSPSFRPVARRNKHQHNVPYAPFVLVLVGDFAILPGFEAPNNDLDDGETPSTIYGQIPTAVI
jgi:hypothetical protein